jgi:hypothetical protein
MKLVSVIMAIVFLGIGFIAANFKEYGGAFIMLGISMMWVLMYSMLTKKSVE